MGKGPSGFNNHQKKQDGGYGEQYNQDYVSSGIISLYRTVNLEYYGILYFELIISREEWEVINKIDIEYG